MMYLVGIITAVLTYQLAVWYAVKGVWALCLRKLHKNLRIRAEREALQETEVLNAS